MNRKTRSGIMLTLLLIGVLTVTFDIQPVKAAPTAWTVDDDGPADFQTIQEAINAASDGDTIIVSAGTYHEDVTVDKSLKLLGENKENTIIEGSTTQNTVFVAADGCILTGFHIKKGGKPCKGGIFLNSTHNVVIDNRVSHNIDDGIWVKRDSNTIANNIVTFNGATNIVLRGNNCTITGNLLQYSESGNGIHAQTCCSNVISGNTISGNLQGIVLCFNASGNIIARNTIEDHHDKTHLGVEIPGFGVNLVGCQGNLIYHNNFVNNTVQAESRDSVNIWDDGYPSGGNYWSDYNGTDDHGDGIGDTPYVINEVEQDNYPLMNIWSTAAPIVNVLSPENGTWYRGLEVPLTFTVDKTPSWMGYRLDAQPLIPVGGNSTMSLLSYGHHSTTVCAGIAWNNTGSSDTINFTVTFLTDLNLDKKVDMMDLGIVTQAYGSYPGHPRWKPIADINKDDKVDMIDVALVSQDFGKYWN